MFRITLPLTLLLAVALSACGGWTLRGSGGSGPSLERVALVSSGANVVAAAMRVRLIEFGIEEVPITADPEATIRIANERFDRDVLSVDPNTGLVTEVLLTLQIDVRVDDAAGETVVPEERLEFRRDYVFDADALLGAVQQESVQQRDLAEDAAVSILLRLEAVESPATAE